MRFNIDVTCQPSNQSHGTFQKKWTHNYIFIACWWEKYENVFTQEYHIPWGQRPRGIWYSWVNKYSYFLNAYAMHVLLYRMKPRKHIHVKYSWYAYFKSIEINLFIVINICDALRVSLTFSCQRTISVAGKPARLPRGGILIFFHRIWYLSCVITCSDFYPLSNQINLFMVINIWGIII